MHEEMNATTTTNTSYPDVRAFSQPLHVRVNSKKTLSRTKRTLSIASWNIRSLVENQGDARICRSGNTRTSSVNRKVDLLAGELDRYMELPLLEYRKLSGSVVMCGLPPMGIPYYILVDPCLVKRR